MFRCGVLDSRESAGDARRKNRTDHRDRGHAETGNKTNCKREEVNRNQIKRGLGILVPILFAKCGRKGWGTPYIVVPANSRSLHSAAEAAAPVGMTNLKDAKVAIECDYPCWFFSSLHAQHSTYPGGCFATSFLCSVIRWPKARRKCIRTPSLVTPRTLRRKFCSGAARWGRGDIPMQPCLSVRPAPVRSGGRRSELLLIDVLLQFDTGENLATRRAAILRTPPVCGLRPLRALRCRTEKVPNPTNVTRSPFFRALVTESTMTSMAAAALVLVIPVEAAIFSTRSVLFIVTPE